jgi:hypothetical protein
MSRVNLPAFTDSALENVADPTFKLLTASKRVTWVTIV